MPPNRYATLYSESVLKRGGDPNIAGASEHLVHPRPAEVAASPEDVPAVERHAIH